MVVPSSQELRREAEAIPTGIPIRSAKNIESNASSSVAGKRSLSVSATGMRR
jgi:hypothetical protein